MWTALLPTQSTNIYLTKITASHFMYFQTFLLLWTAILAAIRDLADCINSFYLHVSIWQLRTWSVLVQVIAWWLMLPCHCLNQCWLIISVVCGNHLRAFSWEMLKISICLKITIWHGCFAGLEIGHSLQFFYSKNFIVISACWGIWPHHWRQYNDT